ncbi:protein insensitive isoform X2 [Drosophila grimshawi]|uniref:protein insensitive isoform X2 n=1 Tax=Drosophila grimshawi TaxID=7222 RepID=UPI000C86EA3C|nr:protein insensitive isoform X2 [Drosophila grimshawi]
MFDAQPARRLQQQRITKMDPHILQANGANFINVRDKSLWNGKEPAMLLTAWTQTTGEDFELLRVLDQQDTNLEAENHALREKVRYLEAKLQEHTDLLSQIHETSARMQSAMSTVVATSPSPPTVAPLTQQQPQILTPPSSVICAAAPASTAGQSQQHPEVIDYKIIKGDDADAIEIRLAAESLNSLSTSADSDRLEICLGNEEHQQYGKRESSTGHLNKRCKLELQENNNNSIRTTSTPQSHNVQYKLPTRRSYSRPKESYLPQQQQQLTDNVMVSIGPNDTRVPASIFENINWSVSSLATRKLLVAIFDREMLATHSMSGKPSPAFKGQHKPLKPMLDPLKVQDIIFAVTHKSNASEKEVRNAITTKCADENKMMRVQKFIRCGNVDNKENISYTTL